jgi:hypothetical protein
VDSQRFRFCLSGSRPSWACDPVTASTQGATREKAGKDRFGASQGGVLRMCAIPRGVHANVPSSEDTITGRAENGAPVTPQESRLMSGIMNEQRTARRYGRAPAQADSRSPGIRSAFRGFCSTPKFGAHFSLSPAVVQQTPSSGGRMRRPEKRTWQIKCLSTRHTRRKRGWSCCAAIG